MSDYPVESVVRPRIWRSKDNKVLAGVVGGLAERFGIDPTFAHHHFHGVAGDHANQRESQQGDAEERGDQ